MKVKQLIFGVLATIGAWCAQAVNALVFDVKEAFGEIWAKGAKVELKLNP